MLIQYAYIQYTISIYNMLIQYRHYSEFNHIAYSVIGYSHGKASSSTSKLWCMVSVHSVSGILKFLYGVEGCNWLIYHTSVL